MKVQLENGRDLQQKNAMRRRGITRRCVCVCSIHVLLRVNTKVKTASISKASCEMCRGQGRALMRELKLHPSLSLSVRCLFPPSLLSASLFPLKGRGVAKTGSTRHEATDSKTPPHAACVAGRGDRPCTPSYLQGRLSWVFLDWTGLCRSAPVVESTLYSVDRDAIFQKAARPAKRRCLLPSRGCPIVICAFSCMMSWMLYVQSTLYQ